MSDVNATDTFPQPELTRGKASVTIIRRRSHLLP